MKMNMSSQRANCFAVVLKVYGRIFSHCRNFPTVFLLITILDLESMKTGKQDVLIHTKVGIKMLELAS